MRLLLVPWSGMPGFMLRIYRLPLRSGHPEVEISTFKGQTIALRLLEKYAAEKKLATFNPEHSLRIAVEVTLPEDVANRILKAISALSEVKPSILRRKVFDELAENPSLEELERVLAIIKLVNGG
ncbi:hypothetical protein B6U84_00055 [Candidatus Bathyarchaeota archaeon ex4484_40]|nr:MAG: hypothetical protein B6U84_00055 [Candidatus Bathyarchaeota archaeon ex4484_40]